MNQILYCNTCNRTFKTAKTLKNHMNSDRHIKKHSDNSRVQYACKCGKKYKHRQGLHVHKKTCKFEEETNRSDETIDIKIEQLKQTIDTEHTFHEKEREDLRKQIDTLFEKFADIQLSSNIDHQTNIKHQSNSIDTLNNVTININAFGSENLDYIGDNQMIKCIERVYGSVPSLIEKIHFNPKHPENHNVKITNKKYPYASVMTKNKKWKTMDKNRVIEALMDKGYIMLDTSYEDNKDKISPFLQERFESFQKKFTNQDSLTMKDMKKSIEISMLNAKS